MSVPREPSASHGQLYLFASLAFIMGALVLAWPWLSGAVTIPWDAKAQAYPQIVFLARALAAGDSPIFCWPSSTRPPRFARWTPSSSACSFWRVWR